MNKEIEDLKNRWRNAKKTDFGHSLAPTKIIAIAKDKMKSTINLQIGTIITLILTAIGISLFFIYVAKFAQLISHIGITLMIGGLILRILIELFSIYYSARINLTESALKSTKTSLQYYQFRKRINGPVTILILVLYTIGFYLLTPEFSLYFSTLILVLIDLSYVIAAIIFTWFIYKTIKKEMRILNEILQIQNELLDEEGEINT